MLALGSVGCDAAALSAALRPTKRRLGCRGTTVGSSGMVSSGDGPRFVASLSSSMVALLRGASEMCSRCWKCGVGDLGKVPPRGDWFSPDKKTGRSYPASGPS